jgi:hypothetical protein
VILVKRIYTRYNSSHQITCFKVKSKSCDVPTRTAEPRRVKTAQNSRRSKDSKFVVMSEQRHKGGGGVKSFRGLEVCNLVMAAITLKRVTSSFALPGTGIVELIHHFVVMVVGWCG